VCPILLCRPTARTVVFAVRETDIGRESRRRIFGHSISPPRARSPRRPHQNPENDKRPSGSRRRSLPLLPLIAQAARHKCGMPSYHGAAKPSR
jgi:hypothetical protein